MFVWGSLTNSWEKKRRERQGILSAQQGYVFQCLLVSALSTKSQLWFIFPWVVFKGLFIFDFHEFDFSVPNVHFYLFLMYRGGLELFGYADWYLSSVLSRCRPLYLQMFLLPHSLCSPCEMPNLCRLEHLILTHRSSSAG